jgi:hypothetical protein
LKGIERATSGGLIQIRVEVRDGWRSIPLALYREREVETDITCEACGLEFAVYGVFAACPDCKGMNASTVFHKSMEAASKRLILLDGDLDAEIAEALLSDALVSAVGAFDAVGKELRRRFPSLLPSRPRNLFQNIDALSTALGSATVNRSPKRWGPRCTAILSGCSRSDTSTSTTLASWTATRSRRPRLGELAWSQVRTRQG